MIDLLRDPVWQFVGAVLAAIAIVIAVFFYYRQRKRKRLSYQILANTPVLTVDEQIRGKLKVSYEDIPVQNLKLLLLKFINTGNLPIATGDFERPLSISFDSEAKILSSEVIASSPSDLSPSISATTHRIALSPLLLNPKDNFTIKALVSEHQGPFSVTARIVGVERVAYVEDSLKWGRLLVGAALTLCLGFVGGWITSSQATSHWKYRFLIGAIALLVISSTLAAALIWKIRHDD